MQTVSARDESLFMNQIYPEPLFMAGVYNTTMILNEEFPVLFMYNILQIDANLMQILSSDGRENHTATYPHQKSFKAAEQGEAGKK